MKKISAYLASSSAVMFMPLLAFAGNGIATDASGGAFGELLKTIINVINDVLIPFILAIAFLVFVWGVFQFFIAGGANDEKKEKGKSLMVYAIAGFVLILAFWGIINLLASSTGLEDGATAVDDRIISVPTTGAAGTGI